MMRSLCVGSAALLLSAALSAAAGSEEAARELPVAEWSKGPLYLEDFKGQVTVLLFYNDDSA